jgi:hypothetical protein
VAIRKVFIQNPEFIPDVADITGMSIIQIEYEFKKAEILGTVCVFEADISAEQAQEIDRRAKMRREKVKAVDQH